MGLAKGDFEGGSRAAAASNLVRRGPVQVGAGKGKEALDDMGRVASALPPEPPVLAPVR